MGLVSKCSIRGICSGKTISNEQGHFLQKKKPKKKNPIATLTGTMQFDGGQTQLLRNFCILDLSCFFEGETLDSFRHIAGRSDGRAAAESFEFDVGNNTLCVYTNLKLHYVAAAVEKEGKLLVKGEGRGERGVVKHDLRRCTNKARAYINVALRERTNL